MQSAQILASSVTTVLPSHGAGACLPWIDTSPLGAYESPSTSNSLNAPLAASKTKTLVKKTHTHQKGSYYSLPLSTYLGNRHFVGGKGARLVRADDRGGAKSFNRRERAHDGVLLGHLHRAQGKASSNNSGETLGDGRDGKRDGNLEVVNGTLSCKEENKERPL